MIVLAWCFLWCFFFFFNDPATTEIYTLLYTLSLHDALPISCDGVVGGAAQDLERDQYGEHRRDPDGDESGQPERGQQGKRGANAELFDELRYDEKLAEQGDYVDREVHLREERGALRGVVIGRRHQPGEFEVSKAEEHGIQKHVCHDA